MSAQAIIDLEEALGSGNAEAIEATSQWLASENNESTLALALVKAATHRVGSRTRREAQHRFVQLALERGANPNQMWHVRTDPFDEAKTKTK